MLANAPTSRRPLPASSGDTTRIRWFAVSATYSVSSAATASADGVSSSAAGTPSTAAGPATPSRQPRTPSRIGWCCGLPLTPPPTLPTTVRTSPFRSTRRVAWLPPSATYTAPEPSRAAASSCAITVRGGRRGGGGGGAAGSARRVGRVRMDRTRVQAHAPRQKPLRERHRIPAPRKRARTA